MILSKINLTSPVMYNEKEIVPIDHIIDRFKSTGIPPAVFETLTIDNYYQFPHMVVLELQEIGFDIP